LTLDGVDELHKVCGWLGPEQDVNVVVFAVEIGQYDTILVRWRGLRCRPKSSIFGITRIEDSRTTP